MTDYNFMAKQLMTLQPEKYGMLGSYAREYLEISDESQRYAMYNDQMLRFVTQILTGRTVSEEQQVSATAEVPATWWDSLMETLNRRLHLYIPVKWKTVKLTGKVKWDRKYTYPEADCTPPPDTFGRPVMWEEVILDAPLGMQLTSAQPSRFANRHEVASAFYQTSLRGDRGYGPPDTPQYFLDWLGKHGVNPDQLIHRSAL